jgi:hypothetical protein
MPTFLFWLYKSSTILILKTAILYYTEIGIKGAASHNLTSMVEDTTHKLRINVHGVLLFATSLGGGASDWPFARTWRLGPFFVIAIFFLIVACTTLRVR